MSLGNTTLVRYGIEEEKADLRFHVSIVTKRVYVFEPRYALEAIRSHDYPEVPARTGNLVTAMGYLVPPRDIKNLRIYPIPNDLFTETYFRKTDSTSIKGKKAEELVNKMIRKGIISPIIDTVEAKDKEMQYDGEDLIALMAESVQIKCDWTAGPKAWGGSGSLFIQTTECNPLRLH